VILRLDNTAPEISSFDIVKKIWWFDDGHWAPQGFSAHGNSYLTLTEQNDDPLPLDDVNVKLFEIITQGTGEPLLVTDRGFVVQKDISAGGFVSSNQGELWLGSGRDDQLDVPKILLTNSSVSRLGGGGIYDVPAVPSGTQFPTEEKGKVAVLTIAWNGNPANTVYKHNGTTWIPLGLASDYAGNFDTLYLRKLLSIGGELDDTTPGDLDLGNLTAHGNLKIGPTNNYAKILISASSPYDWLYLKKADGLTNGHLGVGNLSVSGTLNVGNVISNTTPASGYTINLGQEDRPWNHLFANDVRADIYYSKAGGDATFYGTTTRVVLPSTAPGTPANGEMWFVSS
jgi:hypothetical protein